MTSGHKGWGSSDEASEAILRTYVDAGGNFVDTADVYSRGASETLLGRLIAEGGLWGKIVPASKYTFCTHLLPLHTLGG